MKATGDPERLPEEWYNFPATPRICFCEHPLRPSLPLIARYGFAILGELSEDCPANWAVTCYACGESAYGRTPKDAVLRWHKGERMRWKPYTP